MLSTDLGKNSARPRVKLEQFIGRCRDQQLLHTSRTVLDNECAVYHRTTVVGSVQTRYVNSHYLHITS